MNYYETYAPVVTWFAIQLLIVFGILFDLALCQVDFVIAYPQAPIEMDMYMELIHQAQEFQGSRPQATCKYLRAKASRLRIEQLSCNQATGDQLQAVTY